MAAPKPLRYWDACAFIGLIKAEPDKIAELLPVAKAAEAKHIVIVTSALTITEVVSKGRGQRARREEADEVQAFMDNTYIEYVDVSRPVAILARELIWDHPELRYKDAVHLATAIVHKVPVLETYDADLLDLNGGPVARGVLIRRPLVDNGPLFASEVVPADS